MRCSAPSRIAHVLINTTSAASGELAWLYPADARTDKTTCTKQTFLGSKSLDNTQAVLHFELHLQAKGVHKKASSLSDSSSGSSQSHSHMERESDDTVLQCKDDLLSVAGKQADC